MREFDDFLPMLNAVATGCPRPTAVNAVRQAAITFCERTRSWYVDDDFDIRQNELGYVCVYPQSELFEIESVLFDGHELMPASREYLDRQLTGWHDATGAPSWFTQTRYDTIKVVPSSAGRVHVRAYLRPAEDAEALPDYLSFKHRRTLVDGALEQLLLLPGQSFTNPNLATYHARRFQSALDRDYNLNLRGQQRAPVRTRFRFM